MHRQGWQHQIAVDVGCAASIGECYVHGRHIQIAGFKSVQRQCLAVQAAAIVADRARGIGVGSAGLPTSSS